MRLTALLQLLRPHQWAKNLLVFVPLITSHSWARSEAWLGALAGFVAMCLLASAGYALNDALDAERDRAHPEKSRRPIAAGVLTRGTGLIVALLLAGLALAGIAALKLGCPDLPISDSMLPALLAYLVGTLSYSFWLKRHAIADVCLLSLLYVVRIVVGAAAIGVPLSPWLLAFAGFVFLSLALLKRAIEFRQRGAHTSSDRPYELDDLALLENAGISAAMGSVLVLALYTQSEDVRRLYASPDLVFLLCPVMLFWLLRTWLLARRGLLPGDPVLFAIRDPISWLCVSLMLLVVLWAI